MNIEQVAKECSATKLLGLGESTHGTHEFFDFKSKLFKELVQKHGFNTLLFEDSYSSCISINHHISTGQDDLDSLMQQLYSVWRVKELRELILWLRKNYSTHRVEFVGFDINQTEQNLHKRDELMARKIKKYVEDNPETKAVVWAHNSHLQTTSSNFNQKPMGMFLRKYYGAEYMAIALLFGKGSVSATKLKMNAKPNSDRTLSEIAVSSIPSELAEHELQGLNSKPYFLAKDEINDLAGSLKVVRSIGWGLVPKLVNKVTEQTDIKKAFDGIVYFPKTTSSLPIHL